MLRSATSTLEIKKHHQKPREREGFYSSVQILEAFWVSSGFRKLRSLCFSKYQPAAPKWACQTSLRFPKPKDWFVRPKIYKVGLNFWAHCYQTNGVLQTSILCHLIRNAWLLQGASQSVEMKSRAFGVPVALNRSVMSSNPAPAIRICSVACPVVPLWCFV